MDDHFSKTIEAIRADVTRLEADVAHKKKMVNELARMAGLDPIYAVTEPAADNGVGHVRSDMYYGQDMAEAVKDYLRRRKAAGSGATSFDELYEALRSGGYAFDTKTPGGEKRALRICLAKNAAFHKLPNESFGLMEWYPAVKEKKSGNGTFFRHVDEDDDPTEEVDDSKLETRPVTRDEEEEEAQT